jgi:hypothetical protein
MLEWDNFLTVEQNIADYIGVKKNFRPMGLLDMVFWIYYFNHVMNEHTMYV